MCTYIKRWIKRWCSQNAQHAVYGLELANDHLVQPVCMPQVWRPKHLASEVVEMKKGITVLRSVTAQRRQ
jgi:hypothetical protein